MGKRVKNLHICNDKATRWTNKVSEVNSMQGKTPFSGVECLWRPSSLVSTGYQRFFPRSKAAGARSWQHSL